MYCLFLQNVLARTGKAVYSALSTSQCANYGLFKERIQKEYELVPVAYQQKFRNLVKQGGQTYVELSSIPLTSGAINKS